jgi:uncharacterized sulfatase
MSTPRPNLLVAISDDQAWPHASAYGCPFVRTPAFDRVARAGVLFTNAYCTSPSCSPSRAGLLTGLNQWQMEEGGILWSTLPATYPVYPEILEAQGYHIGHTNKGWGPGDLAASGRTRNPAGPAYNRCRNEPPTQAMSRNDYAANFRDFLDARNPGQPFCFWYGSKEPHRVYEKGSGLRAGKRIEDVVVPPYLPDCEEVRSDLLDYALEIEWSDTHLARMLDLLEERGELANTLVVVTGDNGLPFPRAKANLYAHGLHVPLAVCWGNAIPGGRTVTDFVSFVDLAPTFLEAAGTGALPHFAGRSLMPVLAGAAPGRADPSRDCVASGLERHAYCRPDNLGYPSRCLHTDEWVYIRNYRPERWPAGDPEFYGDIDASPSKTYMMAHREEPGVRELFALAFGRRPAEELYAMRDGYGCLRNVAAEPGCAEALARLRERLETILRQQGDPRLKGLGSVYDTYPYFGGMTEREGWPANLPGRCERGKYTPQNLA